jgi:hypothetical protein
LSNPTPSSTTGVSSNANLITATRFLHPSSTPPVQHGAHDPQPAFPTTPTTPTSASKTAPVVTPVLPPPGQAFESGQTSANVLNVVTKLQSWFKRQPTSPSLSSSAGSSQLKSQAAEDQQLRLLQQSSLARTPSSAPIIMNSLDTSSLITCNKPIPLQQQQPATQSSYLSQFSINMLKLSHQNASNTTDNTTSNQLAYNLPLSIEFLRKLKRPANVPHLLDYTNGQVFQGSVLEDWLMQSLEDHISNFCAVSNNSNNMTVNNNTTNNRNTG